MRKLDCEPEYYFAGDCNAMDQRSKCYAAAQSAKASFRTRRSFADMRASEIVTSAQLQQHVTSSG
eukprot:SAG11_NODE_3634_length_2322_cov_1.922627_2_plen_65_part_00